MVSKVLDKLVRLFKPIITSVLTLWFESYMLMKMTRIIHRLERLIITLASLIVMLAWEHLHPCASKGLGKPFDAAWQKNLPHPSCPGSSNLPGLFKLPAPLTILPGERCSWWAQIPGPHPLAISESCYFWVEATLQGIFLTVFRIEEPVCKVRVGECHPKKI